MRSAYICDRCGLEQLAVIGSKKIGKGYIRRRKKCLSCGNRMTTYEIHAEDFGGRKEMELERLTERFTDMETGNIRAYHLKNNAPCEVSKAIERLGKYEDLEQKGLLLKLPCKVGDTIFERVKTKNTKHIKEHIVKEFIIRAYRFPRIEIYCENENGFLLSDLQGNLDEDLYKTREQAERDLKGI